MFRKFCLQNETTNWSLSTYPQGVSLGLHHARSAFFTTVHSKVLHRGLQPAFHPAEGR